MSNNKKSEETITITDIKNMIFEDFKKDKQRAIVCFARTIMGTIVAIPADSYKEDSIELLELMFVMLSKLKAIEGTE